MGKEAKVTTQEFEKEPYWPLIATIIIAIILLFILTFLIRQLLPEAYGTPVPTRNLVYFPKENIRGLEERRRILEKTLSSAWEIAERPGNILPKKIMLLVKNNYCLAAPYGESDFSKSGTPSGSTGLLPIIPLLPEDKNIGGIWTELESMKSPGGFNLDSEKRYILLGSVPLTEFWRGLIFLSISHVALKEYDYVRNNQSSDEFEYNIIMNSSNGEAFREIIREETGRVEKYYLGRKNKPIRNVDKLPRPIFLDLQKLNQIFGPPASNEELGIRRSLLFMRIIAGLSEVYPELKKIYYGE